MKFLFTDTFIIAFLFITSFSHHKYTTLSILNNTDMKDSTRMQKVISKDGTTIAFWKSGKGQPLLLIHGTTANHSRWSAISPRFEKYFTVYAMDRRGRGGSGDSPDYDIIHEAEDIAAVLESIGEPTFVLAHSYGALCALEAALLTDRIQRLILYEPPIPTGLPLYPPQVADQMQNYIDNEDPEAALTIFFREVVKMPEEEFEKYSKLPMWKSRVALAPTIPRELTIDRSYYFDSERFNNLKVPTLLLLGGESPLIFQHAIQKVDSALPNSKIIVLPNQQHIAMDIDPELFTNEVLKFLLN